MSYAPAAAPAKRTKTPWVLLIIGLILIAAAVAFGVWLGVSFVKGFSGVSGSTTFVSPGEKTVQLEAGDHAVYEQTVNGAKAPAGGLQLDKITVTGPEGPVTLSCIGCGGTASAQLTVNDNQYLAAASFTAPTAGAYTVSVTQPGLTVFVGPSLTSTAGKTAAIAGLGGLGGLLVLISLIWLIVRAFSKPKPAYQPYQQQYAPAQAAAPTPPGWYADPAGSGRQRYWDGQRWTDNYA